MKATSRLVGYGLVLGLALGGGLAVGDLFDTGPPAPTGGAEAGGDGQGTESITGHEPAVKEEAPMGLSITSSEHRLVAETTQFEPGTPGELRFRVAGPDGQALRAYDETHERQLHLIVVSRDLGWFEHVHPELEADGTWHQPLTLPAAGPYRAYADFAPAGEDSLVLGIDLSAPGEYRPAELPAVEAGDVVGDYTVTLTGNLVAGREAELGFNLERAGRPVTDLDPYLGAAGHLVALRAGDLAYLHVHPTSEDLGPEVRFAAHVPSAGAYRLFLDFSHGGVVRTAAFTVEAAAEPGQATTAPGGHQTGEADEHSH